MTWRAGSRWKRLDKRLAGRLGQPSYSAARPVQSRDGERLATSIAEARRGDLQSRPANEGIQQRAVTATNTAALPKPGLFSLKIEKRYYEAVQAYLAGESTTAVNLFREVLSIEPNVPSAHLFLALLVGITGYRSQMRHLEAVAGSDFEMPDRLQLKYLPPRLATLGLNVKITDNVTVIAPFDAVGATLMLVERYRMGGRVDDARSLVQHLHGAHHEDPTIRLSLADLLFADENWAGVVEVCASAKNADDVGAALLHLKGGALFALGRLTDALEAFRDALRKTAGRDHALLKVIRYDRALTYEAAGKRRRAKQDLERLYAVDPRYEDVNDRLRAMSQGIAYSPRRLVAGRPRSQ
jgi:tetratricopeptide (TPR) repeat protein